MCESRCDDAIIAARLREYEQLRNLENEDITLRDQVFALQGLFVVEHPNHVHCSIPSANYFTSCCLKE